MTKTSCALNSVESKLKRKRRKRTSSKHNVNQVNSVVSRANKDFVHFSDLDTFNSFRRPKPSDFLWKKKRSSNTVKANLSSVNHSNLNKNVKRYNGKDLFLCNISHLVDIKSEYDCNAAMHADCNSYDVDVNDLEDSSNIPTIALNEVASNSSTCLLAKASSSQSWLWHQRLSHLNFATINNLVKNNLVQGLPKMKFEKDHLCSMCKQGNIHQKHHKSKMAFASNKPLYLLYMDLCGPMRVQSISGKRYVLVVVDDYSRYTWVFFLHSKGEASEVIISFIKKTQVNLQLQVQRVRTDNGMEFKNKTLAKFFDEVRITQQFSAARTPQQNGVVERRNRTLVEATRTMLNFANLQSFLWAKAIATACFTQNCSIIHKHFDKLHMNSLTRENQTSSSFVCSDVDVIFLMIMRMLESSRQKGILECLLVIQKSLLLSKFTTNELV
nr:putative ribonuclease H-like domain-containing protein [Tanacetum cinerariifolium]